MQTLNGPELLTKEHPFLSGLKAEFYDFFNDCSSLRRFASQQQIFREGAEADHFYLIVSGRVALETLVPSSGTVTVQTLGAGDALGWSWFFAPHKWHFSATTTAPTEVISFDAAALRTKAEENCEFHHELVSRFAKTLYERLISLREQLVEIYKMRP
jgi:CRP-like cAMP-binding protein